MSRKAPEPETPPADDQIAENPPPSTAPQWPQSGGSYIRMADGSLVAAIAEKKED
jgi:hypothetical protein